MRFSLLSAVAVCSHIAIMLIVFYCCHYLKGVPIDLISEETGLDW